MTVAFGDPLYKWVMKNRLHTTMLLIEPQPEIIPHLQQNYASHPRAVTHCGAVSLDSNLQLWRIRPEYWDDYTVPYQGPAWRWASGITSMHRTHVLKIAADKFPDHADVTDLIELRQTLSHRLPALLALLDWTDPVDVLQIDAEGADHEVLQACYIAEIRPKIINYEHCHLTFNSQLQTQQWLHDLGYNLRHWNDRDTLATAV